MQTETGKMKQVFYPSDGNSTYWQFSLLRAGIQLQPALPQPKPSCFAGIRISFESKSDCLPCRPCSGIALVTDQLVVFAAGPWTKAMIDGRWWWHNRVIDRIPRPFMTRRTFRRRRWARSCRSGSDRICHCGIGGGLILGLDGRLRWSESDSSVVGPSVGWPPPGVRCGAVMVVAWDSETVTWTRCFFLGRASGLVGGFSVPGLVGPPIVVEWIGTESLPGLKISPRLDLARAVFDGWVLSGGRMDSGRKFGSGFETMCDGMPPCDARVGCAGGDGIGTKVWRWRPVWGWCGLGRGYGGALRCWSASWNSQSTVGSKNGKNPVIQYSSGAWWLLPHDSGVHGNWTSPFCT